MKLLKFKFIINEFLKLDCDDCGGPAGGSVLYFDDYDSNDTNSTVDQIAQHDNTLLALYCIALHYNINTSLYIIYEISHINN